MAKRFLSLTLMLSNFKQVVIVSIFLIGILSRRVVAQSEEAPTAASWFGSRLGNPCLLSLLGTILVWKEEGTHLSSNDERTTFSELNMHSNCLHAIP